MHSTQQLQCMFHAAHMLVQKVAKNNFAELVYHSVIIKRAHLLELCEDEPQCNLFVCVRVHTRQLQGVVCPCQKPGLKQVRHRSLGVQHELDQLMPALQLRAH